MKSINLDKPMSLLLVEDDHAECARFKDCENNRGDIVFTGITGSSFEGIKYVKNHLPEGVILDMELHGGEGSGIQFLADIKQEKLGFRPLIVVVTNSSSNIVYNHVHENGADLVFYKRQADYSPDMVINSMLAMRKSLHTTKNNSLPGDLQCLESPEQIKTRAMKRINTELDLIGVGAHLKGRKLLAEAIYLKMIVDNDSDLSVINQIAINQKRNYSAITRTMQTAINNAWASSCIDDLLNHYTAKVNYHTGVPTPIEFISYYSDKIRDSM